MVLSEQRATLFQRVLNVKGTSGVTEAFRLVEEILAGSLVVKPTRDLYASYEITDDWRGRLNLPRSFTRELDIARAYLHEGGHHVLRLSPDAFSTARASKLQLKAEEAEVQQFVDAFILPAAVFRKVKSQEQVEDLVYENPLLDLELIRRRKRQLELYTYRLEEGPPSWAAWHRFRVNFVPHREIPHFMVRAVDPNGPVFAVPVPGHEFDWAHRMAQIRLHDDLACLREDEFLLKYHQSRQPEECNDRMHWREWCFHETTSHAWRKR